MAVLRAILTTGILLIATLSEPSAAGDLHAGDVAICVATVKAIRAVDKDFLIETTKDGGGNCRLDYLSSSSPLPESCKPGCSISATGQIADATVVQGLENIK